ncbi:MAG: DUF2703 domain-containing protein [Halodesulfurarchaeum sp.]
MQSETERSSRTSDRVTVATRSVTPEEYASETITVDYLYLDRESCTRCSSTEAALEAGIERVAPLLSELDIDVSLRTVHVDSKDAARQTRLETSPTIRIDGRDLQPGFEESTCEPCGDLAETDVDCRVWAYGGSEQTTVPVELVMEGLLDAATERFEVNSSEDSRWYRLPDNLESFFEETERTNEADESERSDEDSSNCCC